MSDTIRRRETGFFIADNAIFTRKDITPFEKLTYLYLCRRADSEARSFPSYQTIANDCGYSKSSAIRFISNLIKKDLLKKTKRINKNGDPTSNEYILLPVNSAGRGNVKETTGGVVSERQQVVSERHPKDNPLKDEHVVVKKLHAKEKSIYIKSRTEKKQFIAERLLVSKEKLNFDTLLDKRNLKEIKQSIEAVAIYSQHNNIKNLIGVIRKAIQECWPAENVIAKKVKQQRYKKKSFKKQDSKTRTSLSQYNQKEKSLISQLFCN